VRRTPFAAQRQPLTTNTNSPVAHRHRDRGTRGPLGTPFRGNGPVGVSRSFGVRTGPDQRSRRPVRGRSSSRRSPFGSRRCTPFRSRVIRGSGRAIPSLSPRPSSRGARGSSGCSTAPTPSPSAIRTFSGGRRHPCVRGAPGGRGLVRLRRGPADGSPPRSLVTSSSHPGVQSPARAHRGTTWFAGRDAEGHGLRRLCRSSVLHHQHHALSAQRWRATPRHPSLGPGVPSPTGRAA